MKRILGIILVLALAAGAVAGCGNGGRQAATPRHLILATGRAGGTYYPYGTAIAKVFNSKIANMDVIVQETGASVENLRLVSKGEADLAIVQSDMLDYAFAGREMFKDKLPNIRAVAILYPEIIQVVVRADSDIRSFADIKGKRFGVGAPGSGTEANFRQLLEVHGFDYKAMSPGYFSFAEGADQLRDGLVDGFIVNAGIPNPAIADLGADIRIIGFPDEVIAKVMGKYPFFTVYTIPPHTYRGQNEPVKTLAVQATLIANADLGDEIVYNITKTLFEYREELAREHPKGRELSLESAVKGLSAPLHPGAERYYREKGLIK